MAGNGRNVFRFKTYYLRNIHASVNTAKSVPDRTLSDRCHRGWFRSCRPASKCRRSIPATVAPGRIIAHFSQNGMRLKEPCRDAVV